ncbi:MAG: hypothetical protein WCT23_09515 [Candidatus Neomarinimicrobiota bacterium]
MKEESKEKKKNETKEFRICPNCYGGLSETEIETDNCWTCGHSVNGGILPTEKQDKVLSKKNELNNPDVSYFPFKKMITPIIVKILYVLGIVSLFTYGVILIANEELVLGFIIMILGNMFWRIICESTILAFNIHKSLISIEEILKTNQKN